MDEPGEKWFEKYKDPDQNHICNIYRTKDQQFSLIIPFALKGLSANDKCLYIVDENTKSDVLKEFHERCGSWKSSDFDKLIFMTKEESYLRNGYFDPDSMIGFLRETERLVLD